MPPPPPPPTTPQPNTLFNYFSRTPKSTPKLGSNSNGRGETPKEESQKNGSKTASPPAKSPNSSNKVPPVATTPPNCSQSKKRRPVEPLSASPGEATSSSRKRCRVEDSSPSKDIKEGSIVWALLEGFPWWTAMVRSEVAGEGFSRKGSSEYHVQFFDNPPSRAWIRKVDIKLFQGSQDIPVPPAKNDPNWVEACRTADAALQLSPKKRIEKYWVDFSEEDEKNESAGESETEETEECRTPTLKKRATGRQSRTAARKRLKIIDSSDSEEESKDNRGGSSKTSNETLTKTDIKNSKKNGVNGRKKNKIESDNDDEYKPSPEKNGDGIAGSEHSESDASVVEEDDVTTPDEDDDDSPPPTKSKKNPTACKAANSTPTASSSKSKFAAKLTQFQNSGSPSMSSPKPPTTVASVANDRAESWPHLKLSFLQPDKIQDANRRRPDDPKYNPRTLYIPKDFLDKQTPGMRQWWDLKAQNFDTILFFKVGKFYEFYHMDAVTCVEELRILYMKGDFAHSGFPEVSYSKMASTLVEKGYKVARIEQTETPDMMAERCKRIKPTKFDRVVKREICQIATRGVRYASFQDDKITSPFNSESVFLYGIAEKVKANSSGPSEIGVCFLDTTIGTFFIGQFQEDRYCSRLRTLLSHYVPAQILYEKGKLSQATQQLLSNYTDVRKDGLLSETEFWGAEKVLKYLAEQTVFQDNKSGSVIWPDSLKQFLDDGDTLGLSPGDGWELGMKSFGGVVWYLKHCLLDHDLLSLQRFIPYKPVDVINSTAVTKGPKYMVLDGITLRNLDITEGPRSLLSVIDACTTHFGKRKLRNWICMPLAVPEEISARLDAVEELIGLDSEIKNKVMPLMKILPDLERLLNKVHYLGSAHRSKDHPEGRAFFFEEVKYSKNKIADLISVLKGFKTCEQIINLFQKNDSDIHSSMLMEVISNFPSLGVLLKDFDESFDHQSALKEGRIIPKENVDPVFDRAKEAVIEIEDEANAYLKEISKKLGTRVVYFGSDKKRYQMEVSDKTRVPKEYEMSSSRKGFKRYYDSTTKDFLAKVMQAEAKREEVLRDNTRRLFERFDTHRETWKQAVDCICTLDVLLALAAFSSSDDMCRPSVVYSKRPFLNIVDGRHPCMSREIYIPNSCQLGVSNESQEPSRTSGSFILLTGPNMGGKSTLMRQAGVLSVLAHMGCFVPAEKCEMSVVDRIFTRLGANDNIGEGESTFFVEMSETSAILKHSTPNSLILIDELGRGTATYDGTAIAYAVASVLAEKHCRSIFSTHYHTLVETIEHLPSIQLGHMACMVENENEEDPTQETITFLYKLAPGACPKSYGFNAARLAGLDDKVIRVAHRKAKEFEAAVNKVDIFSNIFSQVNSKQLMFKDTKSICI